MYSVAGVVISDTNIHEDGETCSCGSSQDMPPAGEVYDHLRGIAYRYLSRERRDHTLQPTALVHEAYLRLLQQRNVKGLDRQSFVCGAARAMRFVLVDHARRRSAAKRGGPLTRVPLDAAVSAYEERSVDLIELDDALTRLSSSDPQLGQIVEMRFFGGMTESEIGDVLGVSVRTVERSWRFARMWLCRELGRGKSDVA